jgi:ankyrin repeat protein
LAVENVHYELAAFLLDAGADPNVSPQGWTALHLVTWLRKPGVGDNNPAPQGSGKMSSLEFVKTLVAHGANVNARATKKASLGTSKFNAIGATPFLLAARTADVELMRLLLQLGADPKLANVDDTTPLLAAAGVGTGSPGEDPGSEAEVLEAVKLTLELGGDINAVDKNGETVMHGAAHKHLAGVVRLLAERGAKVEIWNQPNKAGLTPLKIADGIQIGMNIVGNAATAAAIRDVIANSSTAANGRLR